MTVRSAGVDFLTMGQYLQPTTKHVKVSEFVKPQAFEALMPQSRARKASFWLPPVR